MKNLLCVRREKQKIFGLRTRNFHALEDENNFVPIIYSRDKKNSSAFHELNRKSFIKEEILFIMQNLTEDIEQYILSLLEEKEENFISLRRKELARIFECVPSQINYVLRSRFTPEHGYLIESRRGEHGYIKILRITCECPEEQKSHVQDLIGEKISLKEAGKLLRALQKRGFITVRERLLIDIALTQIEEISQLGKEETEIMLADILRRMLSGLMS